MRYEIGILIIKPYKWTTNNEFCFFFNLQLVMVNYWYIDE